MAKARTTKKAGKSGGKGKAAGCRLEMKEGTSSKFWEGELAGSALVVRFGRIGTEGQSIEKKFGDAARAQAALEKLIREKEGRGYRRVGGGAGAAKAKGAPKGKASQADLRGVIREIDGLLKKKFPKAYKSLAKPRAQAMATLEKAVGALPGGVRQLYAWKDGGSDFLKGKEHDIQDSGLDWYSASQAVASRKLWLQIRDKDGSFAFRENLLPVFTDGAGNDLCVDVGSADLQLFDVDHETREVKKQGSLEKALKALEGAIRAGRWRDSETPVALAKTIETIEKDLRSVRHGERALERLFGLLQKKVYAPVRDIVRGAWDELEPRHYTAYQLAGYEARACRGLEDADGAFQAGKRLHDADTTFADRLWGELTPWFVERKRLDLAESSSRFAYQLDKENFDFAMAHAKLLVEVGKAPKAKQVLKSAMGVLQKGLVTYKDDVPSVVDMSVQLAEAALVAGDKKAAAAAWARAHGLDSESAEHYRARAATRTPELAKL